MVKAEVVIFTGRQASSDEANPTRFFSLRLGLVVRVKPTATWPRSSLTFSRVVRLGKVRTSESGVRRGRWAGLHSG
jgi:hypothetical protein